MATTKKKAAPRARATSKRAPREAAPPPAPVAPAPLPQRPASSRAWIVLLLVVVAGLVLRQRMNAGKKFNLVVVKALVGRGTDKCQVIGSRHVAVDADGNFAWIYGGGAQMVLERFSKEGVCLGTYSPKPHHPEQVLNDVFTLAYGPDGTLWAAERSTGRVVHLDADLAYEGSFKADASDLTGIAISPKGEVWVAGGDDKLRVYDADGNPLREFAGDSSAPILRGFRLAFDPAGDLAVVDTYRGTGQDVELRLYSPSGSTVASVEVKDAPFGGSPSLSWDPSGFWIVCQGGIFFVDAKGKFAGTAQTIDGNPFVAVPAMGISAKGDWILDETPTGAGADLYRLVNKP